MYKVVLADDENIILESMAHMIEWQQYEMILVDTAKNGLQAYEKIMQHKPHIVITDIKMPGMSGIELITKVREELPDTVFLILSAYGEFEFASKAIELGVKHYLLKPCDEKELVTALDKIIQAMKEKESKEKQYHHANENIRKIMPYAKQQFLRDFIISKSFDEKDYSYFKKVFNVPQGKLQIVLFKADQEWDALEKYALQNMVAESFEMQNIYLSMIVDDKVLVVMSILNQLKLEEILKKIVSFFRRYFEIGLYIAISNENGFESIAETYVQTEEYLKYAFYMGEESIIGKADIKELVDKEKYSLNYNYNYDYDNLVFALKSKDVNLVEHELKNFFKELGNKKQNINLDRYYCMELLLTIIRQCIIDDPESYVQKVTTIQNMNTLSQVSDFIYEVCKELIEKKTKISGDNTNILIDKVIAYVNKNINNHELSIIWVAKNILFMNENYLGRLFYKETNEKFSHYLTRIRIEKAKEMLAEDKDIKNYDVCQQIGFADNTQYFSQVFKKYTGYTPTEFRKNLN